MLGVNPNTSGVSKKLYGPLNCKGPLNKGPELLMIKNLEALIVRVLSLVIAVVKVGRAVASTAVVVKAMWL